MDVQSAGGQREGDPAGADAKLEHWTATGELGEEVHDWSDHIRTEHLVCRLVICRLHRLIETSVVIHTGSLDGQPAGAPGAWRHGQRSSRDSAPLRGAIGH